MNPTISLIIPVYDISDYLKRCIDSCIAQTLKSIEIILVNDCSPDPLDNIFCEEYAAADDRIKYVRHECNKGLGGARNTGLENAKGEYVWFIDSDDFIDNSACEFLHRIAKEKSADIIGFSATSHVNGVLDLSERIYYYYHRDIRTLDRLLDGEQFIRETMNYDSFHVSACLHFFRREAFDLYRFRENVAHEDVDLIPIVIRNARSVYCVKYAPYYRLLRDDSISQRPVDERTFEDKILAVSSLLSYIEENNIRSEDILCRYAMRLFKKNLLPTLEQLPTHNLTNSVEYDLSILNQRLNALIAPAYTQNLAPTYYELEKLYANREKQLMDTSRELNNIKNSRLWRLRNFLAAIKSRLTSAD